jgi:hypothetical protein
MADARLWVVRKAQLEALSKAAENDFVKRVMELVREHSAGDVSGLEEEELRKRVKFGLRRGRSYGMGSETSLAFFVALQFSKSPVFDRHPAIHPILKNDRVKPDERLEGILERVPRETWREVERFRDERSWKRAMEGG